MLKRIKSLFAKEEGLPKAQIEELSRLSPQERLPRLGVVLHDLCVRTAARFVEEQHGRGSESPFRESAKTDLFHEMLVMNFWVLEALFKGKRPALMDQLYRHHNASFTPGRGQPQKEVLDSMRGTFAIYDKAWDDHTGHRDVFARQAIGIIFGGRQIVEAPQAAFWLITYADRTMKAFGEIAKSVDLLLRDAAAER